MPMLWPRRRTQLFNFQWSVRSNAEPLFWLSTWGSRRTVLQRLQHMLEYLIGLHLVGFGQPSLIAAITSRMSE